MRILMLSDAEWRGGANRAAHRLATGLLALGHEVIRAVYYTDAATPPWRRLLLRPEKAGEVAWDAVPNRPAMEEVEGMLAGWLRDVGPDVVNIHNLHGAIKGGWSMGLTEVCLRFAPVLFTMHDMWSFTGRCPYSFACFKHRSCCDHTCPTAFEYPSCPPEHIAEEHRRKKDLLLSGPRGLCGATPSAWMRDEAVASLWRARRVEVIANGLDTGVFAPVDKAEARARLGLGPQGQVVLAVGVNFDDPRKGMGLFSEALALVRGRPLTVLTVGRQASIPPLEGIAHVPLGFLGHEEELALAYNAATAVVAPSLAENLPNTVAEALACGTPVCAFPIGGLPEMLISGHNGQLAREISARGLATALEELLDHDPAALAANCRAWALERYDLRRQARRYLDLFQEMAADRHRPD